MPSQRAPWWLTPAEQRQLKNREERISENVRMSKDGSGYRVRFRGPDNITGERRQQSRRFPPDITPEELELFKALVDREAAIRKLVQKTLRQEGLLQAWAATRFSRARRVGVFDRRRPLMQAKWTKVDGYSGISQSNYGWRIQWNYTDPLTGERRTKAKIFRTPTPPGKSEPPAAHVIRELEERRLAGLEGKRRRRDIPKKNVRAIKIASPAVQAALQAGRAARRRGGDSRGRERAHERQQREQLVLQLVRGNPGQPSELALAKVLAPQIERALTERFGHPVPVSANTVRKDIALLRRRVDRKLT